MTATSVRVRFAPAPTGMMHLGNVRTALMNFLFAQQKQGTFVLRIEDTDQERNYDPDAVQIMADLHWLGLIHNEGPGFGGPNEPYFQSQRDNIYQEKLNEIIAKKIVYRCFCSPEMLEKKRVRQQALGLPPRYDRTCLNLTDAEIADKLAKNEIFVWRFKLDHAQSVTITDLAHGNVTFELKNFSDFPITRGDGTCTFIFANFVDDMLMKITHIFRGEDHLTNTACQAALFDAFNLPLPIYWHMPILCNIEGKKLSKRDFGFSLRDLQQAGYLPEAIVNYLAIIGGSYAQEIMTPAELINTINFENIHTTGQIKYDVEKLRWINRKWIHAYDTQKLAALCKPLLQNAYPQVANLANDILVQLIRAVQQDITTLADVIPALNFYFNYTEPTPEQIAAYLSAEFRPQLAQALTQAIEQVEDSALFVQTLKKDMQHIPAKQLYSTIRLALTGAPTGPSIVDLMNMLGSQESAKRLRMLIELLT